MISTCHSRQTALWLHGWLALTVMVVAEHISGASKRFFFFFFFSSVAVISYMPFVMGMYKHIWQSRLVLLFGSQVCFSPRVSACVFMCKWRNERLRLYMCKSTIMRAIMEKVISIFALLLNLWTPVCLMCSELQHRCHSLSYAGRHLTGCSQNWKKTQKKTRCAPPLKLVCAAHEGEKIQS